MRRGDPRRRAATILSVIVVGTLASLVVARADDVLLDLTHGASAGEALLTWTGGTSPYQVHRSDTAPGLVAPAHVIGLVASGGTGLTDPAVPATGSVFFYAAVSGACGDGVVDLGEGCDDAGTAPGDGCSSVCQFETPASLTLSPGSWPYGNGFVGLPNPAASFQVTNTGDAPSGALSIDFMLGNTGDFAFAAAIPGDCVAGAVLAGHASCTERPLFAPLTTGPKTTTLRVSATPGGTQQATLSGVGLWPLTVDATGPGVVKVDGVQVCTGACPEVTGHPNGTVLTLTAAPTNGSNRYFKGWSGDCSGSLRTCTVTMTQARTVTANLPAIDHNLTFVSSSVSATNLGSVAPYDAQCNTLATAAGLNNVTNNAWSAWISSGASTAPSRLAGARGFMRVDGAPVADTSTNLLAGVMFNPIRLNEFGVDVGALTVMTGTALDGSAQNTCLNWTVMGTSANMNIGDAATGPGLWTANGFTQCTTSRPIYCFMKTLSTPLTVTPASGKKIWLSSPFTPGSGLAGADNRCFLDRPAGVTAARALLPTTSASALSRLIPTNSYVRVDGVPVASVNTMATGGLLSSGIWQDGTGAYLINTGAWTGASTPTTIGTVASTCNNWIGTAGNGLIGRSSYTSTTWWSDGGSGLSCASTFVRLYCVEP